MEAVQAVEAVVVGGAGKEPEEEEEEEKKKKEEGEEKKKEAIVMAFRIRGGGKTSPGQGVTEVAVVPVNGLPAGVPEMSKGVH